MSDYQSDLKISDNILKQNGELYRKIRNMVFENKDKFITHLCYNMGGQ